MKVKSPESSKPDVTRKVSPRNRIKYTAQQLHRLEKTFLSSQYPDSSILEDLSNTLNIDTERLSIWFQNRRSKFKRQAKGSHVTWMRQQLYQAGAQQPVVRDQSEKETSHVLSPPTADVRKTEVAEKPKSNLHYLPSSSFSRSPEYDAAYNLVTSSMYPPMASPSGVYSALSDAITTSDAIHTSLQLNHIVNELSYQQPSPSPYPPTSGYGNPTSYASSYQSYPPYYSYPSTPMSLPHQINY